MSNKKREPLARKLLKILEEIDKEDDIKELKKEEIKKIVAEVIEEKREKNANPDQLKKLLNLYKKTYTFKVGDLVKWKPFMRNRKWPKEGEPAIVVKVLDKPIYDDSEKSISPYFKEPLDIILGVIGPFGEFLLFYFDKQRFMPFEEELEI